jgi:cytidylate kinase
LKRIVVAIDGPAGAGKSTVAREVAKRLAYMLVDTGALYRGVALIARERGVAWSDGPALGPLAQSLVLELRPGEDGSARLHIDGKDRSGDIRTQDIAMGASDVSKHPEVRDALLGLQRQLGRDGGVVLEGRDIGTVVFPDAEAKVFLTATPVARAERRVTDLASRGTTADYETTLAEIRARDAQDMGRTVAPLRPADGSITVDSTELGIEQVVARIVELAERAARG